MLKFKYFLSPKLLLQYYRKLMIQSVHKQKNLIVGLGSNFNQVAFGKNVYIGDNCHCMNSIIGDHSYLNSSTNLVNVTIGKFCSIATNVKIGMGSHPTHLVSTHPAFYSNNKAFETFSDNMQYDEYKNTIIGNDVWIGDDVTIVGGIVIGDGSIIATGAVVTKDIPPYAIYGGVPAKLIKFRFDQLTIEQLLKIKWWEKDIAWIRKNYRLFLNMEDFIKIFEDII